MKSQNLVAYLMYDNKNERVELNFKPSTICLESSGIKWLRDYRTDQA